MALLIIQVIVIPNSTVGQNLVPNTGFEEMLIPSEGYAMFDQVVGWYNPCNDQERLKLYPTPDHLYNPPGASFQKYRTSFAPAAGRSAAGIITYMQRVPNFREYIAIKLEEPLRVGSKYHFQMQVSSGYQTSFGKMGTNGLAVWLSESPIRQQGYGPLTEMPIFLMQEITYQMGYKTVTFEFTAQEASQYLAIGNALPDRSLKKKYFGIDLDPQAYLYIDDVQLEAIEPPVNEPAEALAISAAAGMETTAPTDKKYEQLLESREIGATRSYSITKEKMVVKIWDDRTLDGDVVSLLFNGEVVLDRYELRRRKKRIVLHYNPDQENVLVLHAHNLGDEPPNTAAFSVRTGKKKRQLRLQSDLEKSGAVRFVK